MRRCTACSKETDVATYLVEERGWMPYSLTLCDECAAAFRRRPKFVRCDVVEQGAEGSESAS